MRITITKKDIDGGIRHNACFCPLARALRRKFGNAYLWVTYDTVRVDEKVWRVNKQAKAFLKAYDSGLPVKPQTFTLVRKVRA